MRICRPARRPTDSRRASLPTRPAPRALDSCLQHLDEAAALEERLLSAFSEFDREGNGFVSGSCLAPAASSHPPDGSRRVPLRRPNLPADTRCCLPAAGEHLPTLLAGLPQWSLVPPVEQLRRLIDPDGTPAPA